MKIIQNSKSTSFYLPKESKADLEEILQKYSFTKSMILYYVNDHFIIKVKISNTLADMIQNKFFEKTEIAIPKKDTISGFKGCLITGHKLKWV